MAAFALLRVPPVRRTLEVPSIVTAKDVSRRDHHGDASIGATFVAMSIARSWMDRTAGLSDRGGRTGHHPGTICPGLPIEPSPRSS